LNQPIFTEREQLLINLFKKHVETHPLPEGFTIVLSNHGNDRPTKNKPFNVAINICPNKSEVTAEEGERLNEVCEGWSESIHETQEDLYDRGFQFNVMYEVQRQQPKV